jgi:hypothetical protein
MANDYNGATTVVPVLHKGEGTVHNIAVPAAIPMDDFHSALLDNGYHQPQPSPDNAIENDPNFKKTAYDMYMKTEQQNDFLPLEQGKERGFVINRQGQLGPVQEGVNDPRTRNGHLRIETDKTDIGAAHTHDSKHSDVPSPDDIAAAIKAKQTVYVVSRSGLFGVDPAGHVTRVYQSAGDLGNKKKKASTEVQQ